MYSDVRNTPNTISARIMVGVRVGMVRVKVDAISNTFRVSNCCFLPQEQPAS